MTAGVVGDDRPLLDRIMELEAALREACTIADAHIFVPNQGAAGGGIQMFGAGGVGGGSFACAQPMDLAAAGGAGGMPNQQLNLEIHLGQGNVAACAAAPAPQMGQSFNVTVDSGAPYRTKARVAELRKIADGTTTVVPTCETAPRG